MMLVADAAPRSGVDLVAAEAAVGDLLDALGYDRSDPRLRLTPGRVARNLTDLVTRAPLPDSTLLDSTDYTGLVLVRDIPFHSLCEHHLLPFRGIVHVGYLPAGKLVGLSLLPRIVEYCARDLQMQERLTTQIADLIESMTQARGVGVEVVAEHLCMSVRGVGTPAVTATTGEFRGELTRFE